MRSRSRLGERDRVAAVARVRVCSGSSQGGMFLVRIVSGQSGQSVSSGRVRIVSATKKQAQRGGERLYTLGYTCSFV